MIVWNDPINLMSFVTFVFQKLFGYSKEKATKLMLDVHHKGRAVVSSGTRERAELDVYRLHEHGLWATMEQSDVSAPDQAAPGRPLRRQTRSQRAGGAGDHGRAAAAGPQPRRSDDPAALPPGLHRRRPQGAEQEYRALVDTALINHHRQALRP